MAHIDEVDSYNEDPVVLDFATEDDSTFDIRVRAHPGKRVVQITTATSVSLRDLTGALFDLRHVVDLCEEYVLLETKEGEAVSRLTQDALWMSAIMLYARCFNNGARVRLALEALDSVPGQAREAHQHFLHLRDKFLAHSVNIYEQTAVIAVLDEPTSEVQQVGTVHAWAIPMNLLGVTTLKRLAQAFIDVGECERPDLESQVFDEAQEIDQAVLRRLPDISLVTPTPERAGVKRNS